MRVTAIQYDLSRRIQSFADFAAQCSFYLKVAAGYAPDVVLFPEMFTNHLLSLVPDLTGPEAVRYLTEHTPKIETLFTELARQHRLVIVAGSHFTARPDGVKNVAMVFGPTGLVGEQLKLHITPGERQTWGVTPGSEIHVFAAAKGRFAVQICYDVEFPEAQRLAVEAGAEVIFVPYCTDDRQGHLRVRYCAQARTVENQIYVVTAGVCGNLRGVRDMDVHYAQSAVLTPSDFGFARDGIAAEAAVNLEGVVVADLDLQALAKARAAGTVRNWADRRLDLYEVRLKS